MIEVRLFATLRQGREKIIMLESATVATASDILRQLDIPAEEVSILLVNGFHKNPGPGRRYCSAVSAGGRWLRWKNAI